MSKYLPIILLMTLIYATADEQMDDKQLQQVRYQRQMPSDYVGYADNTKYMEETNDQPRDDANEPDQRGSNCKNKQQRIQPAQGRGSPKMAKERASGIAIQAAAEAKKANDEMSSAVQVASRKIKLEYADKAAAAAKAAEAVLSGKAQVLEQLVMEVREAELVVQEETTAASMAEGNSQMAQKAAMQAKGELKLSMEALKLAKQALESSESVNQLCKQSLAEKTSLLEAAQNRVGVLLRQLTEARVDFSKTKKAAHRAVSAANEAKDRIDRQRRKTETEARRNSIN